MTIKSFLFSLSLIILTISTNAQVGIGTATPASSATLDLTSTSSGLLPPRMTFAQRNAITNPAIGLVIFCTDCDELQIFNGTVWKNLLGKAAVLLSPPFVTICDEDYAVRNLDVSSYRNGDPIPNVTNAATWSTLTSGAYCYFNNDSATYAAIYGKLYNWYALTDPRGVCPIGWHITTEPELYELLACVGGDLIAGGPLKEVGTVHWQTPNTSATNIVGFTGLPGGQRVGSSGVFQNITLTGLFWSSLDATMTAGSAMPLNYNSTGVVFVTLGKKNGLSARCIRD